MDGQKATANAQNLDQNPLVAKLRARRHELGLTMKEVAAEAGLSVGFISQVERGITAPSLSSLVSLSKVLRVDISYFLTQPRAEHSFTRHNQRPVYSVDARSGLSYERVSSAFEGQVMHSVVVHQPPGYHSEPITHEGEEMIFILEGEVTSEFDGEQFILQAGDSVHYPSSKRHSQWNHTDKPAVVLWVGTMDLFGENKKS